ncbi:Ammonium transporter 3 member 1, partial [Cucurbita argyrosperma subsp. argyrosperma]
MSSCMLQDRGLRPGLAAADQSIPYWNNKADNAWQLTAATMVGLQTVPGLVILYGSMVKKKWAVNSAFMALYGFASVLVCWVLWAHRMAFGDRLFWLIGVPGAALSEGYLLSHSTQGCFPMADYVFFQFAFAAITVVLLAGSLLGRMNFGAWMLFVPMWLTVCYTVGAFCIWGNGFIQKYLIDYAGGYVIHLSSGVAGFTAAYWVGPRHSRDRQSFPPNNILHMVFGAGFLWLGWTGFNGGAPFAAGRITSLAILNTHICTATSLLIWVSMDIIVYKKSSVIGAVQGIITGLVCITPGAGLVDSVAAVVMGVLAGLVPWYTMMVLHRKLAFLQCVDDTLGVFHTHAVAGSMGGLLTGFFAKPSLLKMMYPDSLYGPGFLYAISNRKLKDGLKQIGIQFAGAVFITLWNAIFTSIICYLISHIVNLRMKEEDLEIGDDAAHGEEPYALWGDGEKMPSSFRLPHTPRFPSLCRWD